MAKFNVTSELVIKLVIALASFFAGAFGYSFTV